MAKFDIKELEQFGNSVIFADQNSIKSYNIRTMKRIVEYWDALKVDNLGILGIYGGLGNASTDWAWTSYSDITSSLERMMQDDSIEAILICLDSPGGHAIGLLECCDYIKTCAVQKPIYAFIDGMACSAAYAIAVSCDKVYAKKDTITGCCGCYAEAYELKDEVLEEEGWLHKVFRSKCSPRKNVSILTDPQAQKEYQEFIDKHGESYLRYVAESRNIPYETAEKSFGEGRSVGVDYALENGMIDGICTIEDCIKNLIGSLNEGSYEEENNMTLSEQFNALSEEEKATFISEVISANPSLVAERDKEIKAQELSRVKELEELRDGSEAVDTIINAAVEDGKTANDIGLELAKAMKANAKDMDKVVEDKANEQAKEKVVDMLAKSTQTVNPPSAVSEDDFVDEIVKSIQEDK